MRVFLTGATGFVGHYILLELLSQGHTVRCLVREGSLDKLPLNEDQYALVDSSKDQIVAGDKPAPTDGASGVEVVFGDVTDIESIEGDMAGCDAVIHLVAILEEDRPRGLYFEDVHVRGTRTVVEEAKAAGVRRFIHMSANGARDEAGASRYHRTKGQAEEIVRKAGFPGAVIFRPSVIFGDPGEGRPEFASQLARDLIAPFPVMPVLGDGQYLLQPIHIRDVAPAFAKALKMEMDDEEVRTYCVAGTERMTFDEVADRIARGMGKKPRSKVHLPVGLSKGLVNTLGSLGLIPISPGQFQMLREGNTCDPTAFQQDFAPTMTPFAPEHLGYLA